MAAVTENRLLSIPYLRAVEAAARAFMESYDAWWDSDEGESGEGVWDERTVKTFGDLGNALRQE